MSMSLTDRETVASLHGMIFGALFLLAFAGGFAGLYSLKPELITPRGLVERPRPGFSEPSSPKPHRFASATTGGDTDGSPSQGPSQ